MPAGAGTGELGSPEWSRPTHTQLPCKRDFWTLSRDQVALRAGVNAKEVGLLERRVREPGLSKFIDLATAIRVSPLWLLEEAIAWRAANDPAVEAAWANARHARMRVIGTALASAVLACSDSELAVPAVVGE
jgi:hypothetical protein